MSSDRIEPPFDSIGVRCGRCGGSVYMETCRMSRPTDHDDVIASECQRCGARRVIVCSECPPPPPTWGSNRSVR